MAVNQSFSKKDKSERENHDSRHRAHLELADAAMDLMNSDLNEAKFSASVETITFDMEKTLPLPRIHTNVIFYKRQIWLYNLGIHSGKTSEGFFYVWPEGMAGRGAQEVAACLMKHIKNRLDNDVKCLKLWSDSCGGQNRNIKIVLMMRHVLSQHSSLECIIFRYRVSGHSYLPNDSEFGDVECALKSQQSLFTVDEYCDVMKNCRRKKPFVVTKMEKTDFLSSAQLEKSVTNRKKDVSGNPINWLNFRQVKLLKEEPDHIYISSEV